MTITTKYNIGDVVMCIRETSRKVKVESFPDWEEREEKIQIQFIGTVHEIKIDWTGTPAPEGEDPMFRWGRYNTIYYMSKDWSPTTAIPDWVQRDWAPRGNHLIREHDIILLSAEK